MKNLAYEGDATSHGGKILTGSNRIKVKGRRAAHIGDKVSCPIHGDNEIVEGSARLKDGTTPLSRDGDHTQCGAVLIASSTAAQVR
ncbi:PAAR domain-containing protein [Burkholderia pyrrocinia]|uniref:PAAR domain-containing protein n=1 Tax=Burkholderia pyrrocinia TaxID=60550 RepID=A0A2Z5N1B0_BURPY|nr:PAAR domain-containing protein [Burkholderia pyrrocinia]AXF22846.1 PAAR domain-containing protein [Burkholderia pyrrocinia]